jgi:hypothetical protein
MAFPTLRKFPKLKFVPYGGLKDLTLPMSRTNTVFQFLKLQQKLMGDGLSELAAFDEVKMKAE